MNEIYNTQIEDGQELPILNGYDFYFKDFLTALTQVDRQYLIWQYGINQQMGERVFAYEFYYRWRTITESNTYENLILNGEIRKDNSILRHQSLSEVYPDFVLHEQQNTLNQQLIACEIKTLRALEHSNGKKQLKKDIIKLGKYVDELQFRYSIFIQVLNSNNYLQNKLIPYLRRRESDLKNIDRITYVIKYHDRIQFDLLSNLLA
ncbi:hypothetical protein [Marivirga arenosa]|uniref:Uncharacterized protein n=1 Tax=Marivirga arenosa TaxID=3059076 RepID=A0AA49GD09_9BACT|nr:hypothetical protein [Marivirga sp. BKB1-2]WKK83039.1 hypothetical protein QYS47_14225 [Marivirga sp. BKB1-2]